MDEQPPSRTGAYRPAVAAIIRDAEGRVLIGERSDRPGCWQFPQGGRIPGETEDKSVARELLEEVSLEPGDYVIEDRRGPYRYLFPEGRTKEGYAGQEHHYFLLRLVAPAEKINIRTASPEFRAIRWVRPEAFQLDWPGEMKREVYRQVFRDFFGLELV